MFKQEIKERNWYFTISSEGHLPKPEGGPTEQYPAKVRHLPTAPSWGPNIGYNGPLGDCSHSNQSSQLWKYVSGFRDCLWGRGALISMIPLKIQELLDFITLLGEEREQENGRSHLRACDVQNAVIRYRFLRFNVNTCIWICSFPCISWGSTEPTENTSMWHLAFLMFILGIINTLC